MEIAQPRYILELSDKSSLRFVIPDEVISYIGVFRDYPNIHGETNILVVEDPLHLLPLRLWQYIFELYKKHHALITDPLLTSCPLNEANTGKEILILHDFELFDLYNLARALDFYDSPLLLAEVTRVIAHHLLPFTASQLVQKHLKMQAIVLDESTANKTKNPILAINRTYNYQLVTQKYALAAYGLNENIIQQVHHYQPLTPHVCWVGRYHSVILTVNGLYGCGGNAFDQLGTDGGMSVMKLERIPIEGVISVACGNNHTMILTTHGLFALGSNMDGQLGVGTGTRGFINKEGWPRRVFEERPDLTVFQVACGAAFTMIITSDGLYACGANEAGQLGVGDLLSRTVPTKVILSSCHIEVLSLSLANDYALILTNDGVYACGSNKRAVFGASLQYYQVPVKLHFPLSEETMGRPLKVGAGNNHCLILTTQGLYANGSNKDGQLGQGRRVSDMTWSAITVTMTTKQDIVIENFFVGPHQTFLLLSDGTMMGAGKNQYGQLGMRYGDEPSVRVFVAITLDARPLLVASGLEHTLILTTDGLYATGNNEEGQLGISSLLPAIRSPTKVPLVMGNESH